MLILSPSKGQDFETPSPVRDFTLPVFSSSSMELIEILRTYSTAGLCELMQISEKLALLNKKRYASFSLPFTPDNAKQALFSFTGDVYRGIEGETYSVEELSYAQENVRILSGLYGLLRPLDLIQPYRLEMKTRLPNRSGATLYKFWGTRIADEINQQIESSQTSALFNLASNEYSKVIARKALSVPVIDILFKEQKGKTYRTVAIYAKRARGLMTNYMIKNRVDDIEAIKAFQGDGYRFNQNLSTDSQLVFTRPQP